MARREALQAVVDLALVAGADTPVKHDAAKAGAGAGELGRDEGLADGQEVGAVGG